MTKPIIAVVTGASRGAGKGIAIALGKKGAVVYVTGRSLHSQNNLGTITETAHAVSEAGGLGIPVAVDHTDDNAVAGLFQNIKKEYGRLDILVNNAADVSDAITKKIPFWENSLAPVNLLNVGLRSHYVSSYYAAPLLIANGRGLIINTGQYAAVSYYNGPAYGAQKAGADKMAADMAKELKAYNVAANSIWMGFLDTERAQAYIANLPDDEKPTIKRESPEFTGRVIAALYEYDKMMELSGQALIGAELGKELGVTDIDGNYPESFRDTLGSPPELHKSLKD
ncbi:SDR family NAD(P)-dependent oxidoreductase [Chryseobacterium daecheongense]|nr:SDR family NAD(P)-dependent oxidoreductase [Chryseobacterium daecheongense]